VFLQVLPALREHHGSSALQYAAAADHVQFII
jgi:hypothetical protein